MGDAIAVLGGGNGAHAAVVHLATSGFEVRWWRRDARTFAPGGELSYDGVLGTGSVTPAAATDDLAAAVKGVGLVVAPVPAHVQPDLLDALSPVLEAGQAVAFTPGTFGSWLGTHRRADVDFLETGTLPYLARCTGHGQVSIPVLAARLPVGSIPGEGDRADDAHGRFAAAYPMAVRVTSGLDAALTNWGPVIHPPLLVHNLGAIESLPGRFDIHAEGTSPAVRRAILTLDHERMALREAMDLPAEHWPISTHYDRSPLGMYPPDAHDRLVASDLWREPVGLDHRYFHEDVMCGLVLNASLGRLVDHPMPQTDATLQLLGTALGVSPLDAGRTAGSLGITDVPTMIQQARRGC